MASDTELLHCAAGRLVQFFDISNGTDEVEGPCEEVHAVFFDSRVFVHDENVVEEVVDGWYAFGQFLNSTGNVIDGIVLVYCVFQGGYSGIEGFFFFCFKEVRVYVGVFSVFDHVAYAREGLERR